jgi:putative photosynthetic complex assembly protein
MSQAVRQPVFPRGVIMGAGALMLFAIAVAGTARFTNHDHVVMPPTYPIATRDLAFTDLANGGVNVTDAHTGKLISTVAPETGGFLRGIMRGLIRDHRMQGKAPHSSFHLTQWADGRLSIEDPATNESFELEAFGSTNQQVFARFLETPGGQ